MELNDVKFSLSGHSHTNFPGFAYQVKINGPRSYFKAIHPVPYHTINLGNTKTVILLPPLSGVKGRSGLSVIDTDMMELHIILINNLSGDKK